MKPFRMPLHRLALAAACAALALVTSPVLAQAAPGELKFDGVVVPAHMYEQRLTLGPTDVTVATRRCIQGEPVAMLMYATGRPGIDPARLASMLAEPEEPQPEVQAQWLEYFVVTATGKTVPARTGLQRYAPLSPAAPDPGWFSDDTSQLFAKRYPSLFAPCPQELGDALQRLQLQQALRLAGKPRVEWSFEDSQVRDAHWTYRRMFLVASSILAPLSVDDRQHLLHGTPYRNHVASWRLADGVIKLGMTVQDRTITVWVEDAAAP